MEFDASPWGGGFVLREGEEVMEWGAITWSTDSVKPLDVAVGQSKWQTFWELATSFSQWSRRRFYRPSLPSLALRFSSIRHTSHTKRDTQNNEFLEEFIILGSKSFHFFFRFGVGRVGGGLFC